MPSDYARRGRPRGSGLDDRAQLRRVVELLEADPALKPTTAIKALGVNDPSTIRRLRDKLKAVPDRAQPMREPRATHTATSGSRAGGGESAPYGAEHPQTAASSGVSAGGLAAADAEAQSRAAVTWLTAWCALGLSALSTTIEAQMAAMEDFLQVPPVASALRHQLLLNEVAKSFCPKRSDVRTLH
jgi:hypothetical protein